MKILNKSSKEKKERDIMCAQIDSHCRELTFDEAKEYIEVGYDSDTSKKEVFYFAKMITKLPGCEQDMLKVFINKKTGISKIDIDKEFDKHLISIDKKHSQYELAQFFIGYLGVENILYSHGRFWIWQADKGIWNEVGDRVIKKMVQGKIGSIIPNKINKHVIDGIVDIVKSDVYKHNHCFNKCSEEIINCENGEVVLRDYIWHLRPAMRESYRNIQIPHHYDDLAVCPQFDNFLNQIFRGDEDVNEKKAALLEMIGYTLMTHCRHEMFVILVGEGANGKSVLLSLVESLCGIENIAGVQPSQFDRSFQRAHLDGKLANIVTEINQGETIADASLKGIVSGEPTTVEHKFKDPYVMHPFSTCWFGTNHMPHTKDYSDALYRRALILEFNNTFKPELGNCDKGLKDKLLCELPGILRVSLDAYANAIKHGFTLPKSSKKARDDWRIESDQVAQFIQDMCISDPVYKIQAMPLFSVYQRWVDANGIRKSLTIKAFRVRLTKLGYGCEKRSEGNFVTGLKCDSSSRDY